MLAFLLGLLPQGGIWQGSVANGQIENPVYTDDSPQAWELFRQAQDQTRNNAGEAIRLYQELLDEFALKLIPISEALPDQFQAVRQRVRAALLADSALLDRYRIMQKPVAEQLLQTNQLHQLAMTRSLTESGLEALLRLAQKELEAARFHAALTWLDQAQQHPDLVGKRAAHHSYMTGMAAHYLHQPQLAHAALSDLAALGVEGEALWAQLEQTINNPHDQPNIASVTTTLNRGQASDLNDLVAQAIWTVPLDDSLMRRHLIAAQEDQGLSPSSMLEQRLRGINTSTAVPTVVGETIYINEGQTVRALNRLTGRQLWSYSNLGRLSLTERDMQPALDLSVVAATSDVVVTLTGHAQRSGRSESGRVICLDAQTGSLRWSTSLANVIDAVASSEQLFPHGSPVIVGDTVFVMARRTSTQSMTSVYVVAMKLSNGDIRFTRYITSSGGLPSGTRPFDTLVSHNGALYVASAVGAVAKIDPTTGETQWLCRFSTPMTSGFADSSRRPWEIGGPVVTPRGVLAIQPAQRRVVLLDSETGSQLESHDAGSSATWALPRYLLADDERVYAIGSEIRAFDLDDLENPVWRLPEARTSQASMEQGSEVVRAADASIPSLDSSSFEIRGRVQLVDGAVIVPTAEGVLVVDSEYGDIKNKLALQTTGNPLAVDSQLLVAGGDRLDAYMSFQKAERMLRDRIAQTPNEPEPALSLLRLGMRVRNLSISLEAAQLATNAITRLSISSPDESNIAQLRNELFGLLLELAANNVASSVDEGEGLFAAINAAAVDHQQRVEYLLSYGDWLSHHALHRAVESYQAILADRNLADAWRGDGETMRPAAAWARQRLSNLLAQRGRAVYAPQADFAAIRLAQMTAAAPGANGGTADPDALLALAVEFPFADAAIDATLLAASIQSQQGKHREALAALMHLYRAVPRPDAAERLLGKFVSICKEIGWNNQVEAVLHHVLATHGDIALQTDEGVLRPTAIGNGQGATGPPPMAHSPLPAVGEPAGEAQAIAGSLVSPYRSASVSNDALQTDSVAGPADRALVRLDKSLRLLNAKDAAPLWTQTVAGELPQLMRFDDRGIVVWMGADLQDPKVAMLDPVSGETRWTTPRLSDVLADPVRDLGRSRGIREPMPDGEPFNPMQTLGLLNDHSIIFVQRSGGVAAIDLTDGKSLRWSNKRTLEQVHIAALHESTLVLAGMSRALDSSGGGGGKLTPRILMFDPQTGTSLLDQAPTFQPLQQSPDDGVKWLRMSPMGVLVYGTAEGVHAVEVLGGKRLWSSFDYTVMDSQRAWLFGDRVIVEDHRGRLRSIDVRDGAVSEPFEVPTLVARGEWDPMELRSMQPVPWGGSEERVAAMYPQRVVLYDQTSGMVRGADVISDDRDYRWLLPAQDRMVLINSRSMQLPVADQPGRRTQQWVYGIYSLSENCKVLSEPVELPPLNDRVQQAALMDGWLLLSTQSEIVAVPMPAKGKIEN